MVRWRLVQNSTGIYRNLPDLYVEVMTLAGTFEQPDSEMDRQLDFSDFYLILSFLAQKFKICF